MQIKYVLPAEIVLLSSMYSTAELKAMFNNEQVFIILLCRLHFRTATKQEAEDFLNENNLDSPTIWKIASVHNIRPVLYHIVQQHQLSVEESLLNKLKQYYLENQIRSLEQLSICHDVITSLKKNGIDAIPFKGIVFSEMYYSNSGLRESTDIDLFISSKDVAAAESVLQQKGFAAKLAVPPSYLNYYIKNFKEIVYTAPAKTRAGYSVELHWKLLNYYFGDYPGFKFFEKRTTSATLKNLQFDVLEPTADFLAVASNHLIKDLGVKFKYLVDLACLLQKNGNELNYQLIIKLADEYGCRKRFTTSLELIEKLLGVKSGIFQPVRQISSLQSKSTLRVPLPVHETQVTNFEFLKHYSACQDDGWKKLKFLTRSAFYFFLPTDNDINQRLAKRKLPIALLAFIRPFRLIAKAMFHKNKAS